uniref:Uncharacterized protein n=1 Tax=Anguilla anguilla TaxID=7936 RepID=A0A0E9QN04_ANGAN
MLWTNAYFILIWLSTPQLWICNQAIHMWLKCIFSAFI